MIPYFGATHVEILACDCAECLHWEIVRMADGSIHLHCKTCELKHELDSFKIHEDPKSKMRWVPINKE